MCYCLTVCSWIATSSLSSSLQFSLFSVPRKPPVPWEHPLPLSVPFLSPLCLPACTTRPVLWAEATPPSILLNPSKLESWWDVTACLWPSRWLSPPGENTKPPLFSITKDSGSADSSEDSLLPSTSLALPNRFPIPGNIPKGHYCPQARSLSADGLAPIFLRNLILWGLSSSKGQLSHLQLQWGHPTSFLSLEAKYPCIRHSHSCVPRAEQGSSLCILLTFISPYGLLVSTASESFWGPVPVPDQRSPSQPMRPTVTSPVALYHSTLVSFLSPLPKICNGLLFFIPVFLPWNGSFTKSETSLLHHHMAHA